MSSHHVHPFTGVINPCSQPGTCSVPTPQHFPTSEQAYDHLLKAWKARVDGHRYSRPFAPLLEQLLFTHGWSKPLEGTKSYLLQQELLTIEGSFHLLRKLYKEQSSRGKREVIARVAACLLRDAPHRRQEWESNFHGLLPMGSDLVLRMPLLFQATTRERAWVAESLWLKRHAPLRPLGETLLLKPFYPLRGYHPLERATVTSYQVKDYVNLFSISQELLPPGVVAYDVETDTSRGMGSVPTSTQITEVVLASRERAVVLRGDERQLLNAFADHLNALPRGTLLVGWNNYNYDNIMLQTRADFHQVAEWKGTLLPTLNHTYYKPRGPHSISLRLLWERSPEDVLHDVDGYQVLMDCEREHPREETSLKGFVKALGCCPVEVDRSNMHLLTSRERESYALSDGLATLRAWGALSSYTPEKQSTPSANSASPPV